MIISLKKLVDVSPQAVPVKLGITISLNPLTDNFTEVEGLGIVTKISNVSMCKKKLPK